MTRVGIISNPRSRQNLKRMAAIRAQLARHPRVRHRELQGRADNAAAVREMAEWGAELVIVSGGDGTVQGVLTEIVNGGQFASLPRLAVLPSGMTNLIAHDVGLRGEPERALARLVEAAESGAPLVEMRRRIIGMRHAADQPPTYGLFCGTAAFYRGTILARDQVHRLGVEKSLAAGLSLAWFLVCALLGRKSHNPLYRGEPMTVEVDGVTLPEAEQFILLGTTLERLILGLMPFWGDGTEGLRYTSVAFPPERFRYGLLPLLRGRPRPWMADAGYHSGVARELILATDCPIIMDGEIFPASRHFPVRIWGDREVAFVRA